MSWRYDGGADHITAYGGVTAANVGGLVEGAIFTRGPKDKKNTAIFIGGGNMAEGQALLGAVRAKFFAQISRLGHVRLQWLEHHGRGGGGLARARPIAPRASAPWCSRAPVRSASGRRRCSSSEGATVAITGRKLEVVQAAMRLHQVALRIRGAADRRRDQRRARRGRRGRAHRARHRRRRNHACWRRGNGRKVRTLELVADANASPPAGIEGVAMADRGTESHGKILFGAAGLRRSEARAAPRLHRAAVRAERPPARCRGDLRARQDHGRRKGGGVNAPDRAECDHREIHRGFPGSSGEQAIPRRAAAAPRPSWARWARHSCPWSATCPSARKAMMPPSRSCARCARNPRRCESG